MQISVHEIENILIKEDIEGFIENGAPLDEYSIEARYIARALLEVKEYEVLEENILAILSVLWANAFDLSKEDLKNRLPSLIRVAAYIINSRK